MAQWPPKIPKIQTQVCFSGGTAEDPDPKIQTQGCFSGGTGGGPVANRMAHGRATVAQRSPSTPGITRFLPLAKMVDSLLCLMTGAFLEALLP